VIKYGNVQQITAILDLLCDFGVGFARLEIAAGMIVSQNNAGCMVGKANLEDLLRIDDGSGYTAFGNPDFLDDPVCLVQCLTWRCEKFWHDQ